MDSEIKERWIAKLRSGDYAQTDSKLSDDDGYCCLGVLCEIAVEDGIVIKTRPHRDERDVYTSKTDATDYESSVLPFAVKNWAGLIDTNPEVTFAGDQGEESASLAQLNDEGASFRRIADLIEDNL